MDDATNGNWVVVGRSEEIPENEGREYFVRETVLAIFRSNGRLFALDGICAHQGGPLAKGTVSQGCVTCPWHGWQYHLDSGHNAITQRKMLTTFEVRETDGNVEVLLK